jgi:hypothetical protein
MEIHLCLGAASIAARLAADRRPASRRCADLEEAERLLASLDCGASPAPFVATPAARWATPPALREHAASYPTAAAAIAPDAPLRRAARWPT